MDICQNCAQIVRGRSKFCNGCGISISRHSSTAVPGFRSETAALVLERRADPLVLERTVNRIIYGNGNGHSDGTGGFLYESVDFPEEAPDAGANHDLMPSIGEAPAAASGLSKVLGAAALGAGAAVAAAAATGLFGQNESSPAAEDRTREFTPDGPWEENAPEAQEPASGDRYFSLPESAPPADESDFFDSPAPAVETPPPPPPPPEDEQEDFLSSRTKVLTPEPQSAAPENDDFFPSTQPAAGREEKEDFFAEPERKGNGYSSGSGDDFFGDDPAPKSEQDFIEESSASLNEDDSDFFGEESSSPAEEVTQTQPPPQPEVSAPVIQSPAPAPANMDFFAATGSGFFTTNRDTPPTSPMAGGDTFVPAPTPAPQLSAVIPPTVSGGGQASIIQSAIQAAMNAQKVEAKVTDDDEPSLPAQTEKSKGLASKKKKKKAEEDESPATGSRKKKSLIDDDEDSPDDQDEDEKSSAKKKSSSSGSRSSTGSKSKTKKPDRKTRDAGPMIDIMGFQVSQNMVGSFALVGVIGVFVLVVLFNTAANVLSSASALLGGGHGGAAGAGGGGGGGFMGAPAQDLTGRWQIAFKSPNDPEPTIGQMQLGQRGNMVQGQGVDPKAPFQMVGEMKGDVITFNKQYIQNGQPVGKPIVYRGKIDGIEPNPQPGQPFMHISGVWQFEKGVGYSWRRKVVTYTGPWEAALMSKGGGAVTTDTGTGTVSIAPTANDPTTKDPKKAQEFFFKIAIGLLGLGGVLVFASLKFFGPSGLLNIWAKKEYIPSQFKSQHYKLVREMGKPLKKGGMPIGQRTEWGIHQFYLPKFLTMPPEIRETNPHLLIIGQGSKGKTRLMANLIAHDIESADRAVVVVDSDGGLIDMILNWMASHPKGQQMSERVILIDPTHKGDNMCYNPLEFPDDGDLQNAASAVVFGFKAIYTEPPGSQSQWNQQTANILRNSAVLLMANGKTLTDLPVLLSDNDFRDVLLEKVERMKGDKTEYTTLIENWTNYKRLARTDQWINWIEPILNRVQPMLSDPRIRPILTKAKSDLNLKQSILDKKILFVKIPQGQLDQNGNLLGSLILTGVKQAALSLSVKYKDKKRPCALYLDEFDNFIEKETFDAITTETRKFQIGLCSVAKTLQGLPEDYRNQIIANIGQMAVFALTKKDGDMLGPQMFRVDGRKVKHQTISNVFNRVNTSPQFELISDEEKLNIDRVVAQEERTFFFYRVGSVAGVFNCKAAEFKDVPEKDINFDLIESMYENRQKLRTFANEDKEDEDDDDE